MESGSGVYDYMYCSERRRRRKWILCLLSGYSQYSRFFLGRVKRLGIIDPLSLTPLDLLDAILSLDLGY